MIVRFVLVASLVLAAGKHEKVEPEGLVVQSPIPGLENPGAMAFTGFMDIETQKLISALGARGKGYRIDYGATITQSGVAYYFRLTGPEGEELGRKIPANGIQPEAAACEAMYNIRLAFEQAKRCGNFALGCTAARKQVKPCPEENW